MVQILVADDDPEIVDLLNLDLELMGYQTDVATDGAAALKKAESKRYDLVILDVMMPKMDGFEVCRKIRSNRACTNTPIILLTAKGTMEDKIRGFNAGADDYLVKPFEFQELMVRMRALFRRTGVLNQSKTQQQRELLHSGHIQLHPTSLECTVADKRIKLTPTEFEILYCLLQHVGNAVQLSTLLQEVWGYDADEDVRMLRVHVGGLRQKIEPDPKKPSYIETVTNVGYRLNDTPELTADGSALAAAERSEEAVASGS